MRLDWLREHLLEKNPHGLTLEDLLPSFSMEDVGKVLHIDQSSDLLNTEVKWKPPISKESPSTVMLAEDLQVDGNTFIISPLVVDLDLKSFYLIEAFLIYSTDTEIPAFTFDGAGTSPLDGQRVGMITTTTDAEQITEQAQVFLLPVANGTRAFVLGEMILETVASVASFYLALCSLTGSGQVILRKGSCLRYQKLG